MGELSQDTATGAAQAKTRRRSWTVPESLRLLVQNKMSAIGLVILAAIVTVTVLAPWLTSQNPTVPQSLPGQAPS